MIYLTNKKTKAYIWNTAEEFHLKKGTKLSDYTSLLEEVGQGNLQKTLARVEEKNDITLHSPKLMTITTGKEKGCRVWINGAVLNATLEEDPKEEPDFYVLD